MLRFTGITAKTCVIFLSILLSGSVMAQDVSSSNQDLQNVQNNLSESGQALYNALYSKDCSIPEGTQILHYPMMHRMFVDRGEILQHFKDRFNVEETVAFSQWRLLQLIRQHPNALLFEESVWTERLSDFIPSTEYEILENLQSAESYKDLKSVSKQALYNGASVLALHLNFTERLYPTTLLSSYFEVFSSYWESVEKDPKLVLDGISELPTEMMNIAMQYRQEESEDRRQQIKKSFHVLFEEFVNLRNLMMGMIIEWREHLLFESVHQTLNEEANQDRMVIVAYGGAHDFSDNFRDYNFYTLPYSCSIFNTDVISPSDVLFVASMFDMNNGATEEIKYILSEFVLDNLDHFSDEDVRPFYFLYKSSPKLRGVSEEEFSVAKLREHLIYTMDSSLEPWEKTFNDYSTMNNEDRAHKMKLFQMLVRVFQQLLGLRDSQF